MGYVLPIVSEGRRVGWVACAAVAVTAFVFGFHKIDDFDTWWHLAAGRWIATHHAIPATDTLSHTVRDHAWINLQWGFDLALYLLNNVGGAILLCTSGAVVFSLTVVLLMRTLSRHIPASLTAILMMVVILAAEERVTLRPELISFALLAAMLLVIDDGRRDDGRGLWRLVPLMIVWVNVHALFVIGVFAILCGLIGTLTVQSRRALVWSVAAIASVLLNPFGLKGVVFPFTLVSRINGSNPAFQTIGEFASPFADGASGTPLFFYKVLLIAAVVSALVVMFMRRSRRFNWGGLIFAAGLAVVSVSARRNVALFAIGAAPFVAECFEQVIAARPKFRQVISRRDVWLSGMAAAAALLAIIAVVTGALYRYDNSPQEFGAGVIEGTFPVRAVAFSRAARLPGKLYNDMASGGYLSWDDPISDGVFGVYIDGRLEVYDAAFVTDYVTGVASPVRWQSDADRHGIQTAIVFHRFENDRQLAGRLAEDHAWSLVYTDEVAAIFVRKQGNDEAIARAGAMRERWDAATEAWLNRPIRKWPYPAGRIEGTRAYARFEATIGHADAAIGAYLKLVDMGISPSEEIERRLLLARYFSSHGRKAEAEDQARRILAIDPEHAEARRLLQ